jgi:hypothetical protein
MDSRQLVKKLQTQLLSLSIIAILILISQPVMAADITLAWDQFDDSIAGYRLYQRRTGESYDFSTPTWEGAQSQCILHNIDEESATYFVVRSFNRSGLESTNSNEARYSSLSLPNLADAGTYTSVNGCSVGIRLTENAGISRLDFLDAEVADTISDPPATFPCGLFDMEIQVDRPGESIAVVFQFQNSFSENNEWWCDFEENGWHEYTIPADLVVGGTRTFLVLTDGGEGDADGDANGVITHRSGLGVSNAVVSAGSDGGGCFIGILPGF